MVKFWPQRAKDFSPKLVTKNWSCILIGEPPWNDDVPQPYITYSTRDSPLATSLTFELSDVFGMFSSVAIDSGVAIPLPVLAGSG